MKFVLTPEEAQKPARAVAAYLRRQGMIVKPEATAWANAPYRTTLLARKAGLNALIEVQGAPDYTGSIKNLAVWLAATRLYVELYLATTTEATLQAGMLTEIEKDGIGLFLVEEDGHVSLSRKARNPALVVTPDPTIKMGNVKTEVMSAVRRFNEEDRKDGLRDMCELVERETEKVAVLALKKGWLSIGEDKIKKMDWANQINMLASGNSYNSGHSPLMDSNLKDDMHSFRGARNLVDHKVRSKREEIKRQRQFAERMMMGPRLVSELISLKRKIR